MARGVYERHPHVVVFQVGKRGEHPAAVHLPVRVHPTGCYFFADPSDVVGFAIPRAASR